MVSHTVFRGAHHGVEGGEEQVGPRAPPSPLQLASLRFCVFCMTLHLESLGVKNAYKLPF